MRRLSGGSLTSRHTNPCTHIDVQQLTSNIDIMLFYEERARLVIITRNLMLTQYQVQDYPCLDGLTADHFQAH